MGSATAEATTGQKTKAEREAMAEAVETKYADKEKLSSTDKVRCQCQVCLPKEIDNYQFRGHIHR